MSAKSHAPTPGEQVFQVFNEIGIINQLAVARLQRRLGGAMSVSEFSVLNHFVRVGDGKTPSRLARIFQMSKPSMTAIVAKLQAKGFVNVTSSEEDRRVKIVTITKAGRRARDRAVKAAQELSARTIEEFGLERMLEMLPTLTALRTYLDEARNADDGL